jgi:lipoprotein Spr
VKVTHKLFAGLLVAALCVSACKTKKSGQKPGASAPYPKKEYAVLSQKLNLAVTQEDNLKLYRFVSEWLGTPHQLGQCTKAGVDCSCFIRMAYQGIYSTDIPRTSTEMYDKSKRIGKSDLKEGDLVFFSIKTSMVSHVGIYLKEEWFAHVSTSKGVMINNLSEKYYAQYYTGGGKI